MASRASSPSRKTTVIVFFLYFVGILYGSFIPFRFTPRSPGDAWTAFLGIPYLELGPQSRADWVANILLYIPLGFLGMAALSKSVRRARLTTGVAALAACSFVAVAVEFTQIFFARRTVSKNDILAEVTGSALGVLAWWLWGERSLELFRQVKDGGLAAVRAALLVYALSYLFFNLFPYDFLTSVEEIVGKVHDGGWSVLMVPGSCRGLIQCAFKLAAESFLTLPLGLLLAMTEASHLPRKWKQIALIGLGLGLFTEGLQFFLVSGISQGLSVLTKAFGFVVGHHTYAIISWTGLERAKALFRPVALVVAIPYLVILVWVHVQGKGGWISVTEAWRKLTELHFLPFYYHYFTTEQAALVSFMSRVVLYAPLGIMAWLRRASPRRASQAFLCGALAAGLATLMEVVSLFPENARPDPTNVLIAFASATGAYVFLDWTSRWLFDAVTELPRVRP